MVDEDLPLRAGRVRGDLRPAPPLASSAHPSCPSRAPPMNPILQSTSMCVCTEVRLGS